MNERLEEMKEYYYGVHEDNVKWLIQQLELLDSQYNICIKIQEEMIDVKQQNQRYKQALEDIKNYVKEQSELDHYRGDHIITMAEFDEIMFNCEPISEGELE